MKNKTLLLGIITLACIFTGGNTMAEENAQRYSGKEMGQRHKGDHERMSARMDSELNLSSEQKTRMQALREAFSPTEKAVREDLRSRQTALREMLDGNAPDRAAAETMAKEINALQNKLMANHIDHIFKVREILTPEQYKKLEELRKAHKESRKNRNNENTEKSADKK
jgi:Spy/CpxP family protein refolding chaperone